jgi:hypothetical protein
LNARTDRLRSLFRHHIFDTNVFVYNIVDGDCANCVETAGRKKRGAFRGERTGISAELFSKPCRVHFLRSIQRLGQREKVYWGLWCAKRTLQLRLLQARTQNTKSAKGKKCFRFLWCVKRTLRLNFSGEPKSFLRWLVLDKCPAIYFSGRSHTS